MNMSSRSTVTPKWWTEASSQRHSQSGLLDLMLVFPAGRGRDDTDEELPEPGDDPDNPAVDSAPWYLKQFILDDCIFTMNHSREDLVSRSSSLVCDLPSNPNQALGALMASAEAALVASCADEEDDDPDEESWDSDEPIIKTAYHQVKSAKTKGELRRYVLDLMLRYLLCRHCGFEVRAFSSVDEDEFFVGVSASDAILRAHADKIKYRLQVSADIAAEMLGGRFNPGEFEPPFVDFDWDEEDTFIAQDDNSKSPFRVFSETYAEGSIFHSSDRVHIITAVLRKVFDLRSMVALGLLQCNYPVHNQLDLEALGKSWAKPHIDSSRSCLKFKAKVSKDIICTYFGAKVAFRVCFLRFLSRRLVPLAVVAVVLELLPLGRWAHLAVASLLMLWSATAEELWKREESVQKLRWGMEEFSDQDAPRPQFFGTMGLSRADRATLVKFYQPYKHMLRKGITNMLTVLFNVIVVGCTLALYGYHDRLLADGHHNYALGVNMVIALQIQVFNAFWVWAAERLTNFENHERQSQYADALVIRNFSTYFITSFCSVFYIAFVKHFTTGAASCNMELAKQLRVLFLINMCFHFLSVVLPYFTYRMQLARERWTSTNGHHSSSYDSVGTTCDSMPEPSYSESQAKMMEYSLSEEIYDRMDVWVELGYVLFFGLVAPDIIVLFLVSNLMRLHALGWKLTYTMRRGQPDGADGIGATFRKIFQVMAHVAVASNIVLLMLNNAASSEGEDLFNGLKALLGTADEDVLRDKDWRLMLSVFWPLVAGVTFVRWAIDAAIPDVPLEVELQKERRHAVLKELSKRVLSNLKHWEGRELERAYSLMPTGTHRVLVLTSARSWALASAPSVAAGHTPAPPWTSADPDFERSSLAPPADSPDSGGRSPRIKEEARRLVYAM